MLCFLVPSGRPVRERACRCALNTFRSGWRCRCRSHQPGTPRRSRPPCRPRRLAGPFVPPRRSEGDMVGCISARDSELCPPRGRRTLERASSTFLSVTDRATALRSATRPVRGRLIAWSRVLLAALGVPGRGTTAGVQTPARYSCASPWPSPRCRQWQLFAPLGQCRKSLGQIR